MKEPVHGTVIINIIKYKIFNNIKMLNYYLYHSFYHSKDMSLHKKNKINKF